MQMVIMYYMYIRCCDPSKVSDPSLTVIKERVWSVFLASMTSAGGVFPHMQMVIITASGACCKWSVWAHGASRTRREVLTDTWNRLRMPWCMTDEIRMQGWRFVSPADRQISHLCMYLTVPLTRIFVVHFRFAPMTHKGWLTPYTMEGALSNSATCILMQVW